MRRYSIVSAVYKAEPYIGDFLRSLAAQTVGLDRLEIILVDDGSPDKSVDAIEAFRKDNHANITLIRQDNGGVASARNAGLSHVTSDWVTFPDPDDILAPNYFQELDRFLESYDKDGDVSAIVTRPMLFNEGSGRLRDAHPLRFRFTQGDLVLSAQGLDDHINLSVSTAVLNMVRLGRDKLTFDTRVVPTFEDGHFFGRFVARAGGSIGFAADAHYHYRKRSDPSSLVSTSWQQRSKFLEAPRHGYLALLEELAGTSGHPASWVQKTVLYDLQWLYRDDAKVHSKTRWLSRTDAREFHSIVEEIMSYIEEETIWNFNIASTPLAINHAFLSYKPSLRRTPTVALGRYDKPQRLLDLRYFYHGDQPDFRVLIDGTEIQPVTGKRQSCRYFGEDLFHNQILWIRPPKEGTTIEIRLDGQPAPMVVGSQWRPGDGRDVHYSKALSTLKRRRRRPGGRRRRGTPRRVGVRDRLVRWLATSRIVKWRFASAWLFMDRDTQADDNAEHLYRWVQRNAPGIKSYFLLRRTSHDWARLKRDGFKLLAIGSLRWKLALLNARHLASSHLDAYVVDPLPRATYDDLMNWRFIFLQHGVITNDMSNWINTKFLDLMITSTPAEHDSIAADDTPYKLTNREVRRTGLARHDALLAAAADATMEPTRLVVMPTWRKALVGQKEGSGNTRSVSESFYKSAFALQWKAILHDQTLRDLASLHGLRIAFMPHLNMQSYLDWFNPPEDVDVLSHRSASMQELFVDSALLITDYSSVAFDIAFLQRPVVYFQFDRNDFFGGDHLWRPGYFDYRRHGFGPVAEDAPTLLHEVGRLLQQGEPGQPYLDRMKEAFPVRDGRNCERIYRSIKNLDRKQAGLPDPEADLRSSSHSLALPSDLDSIGETQ